MFVARTTKRNRRAVRRQTAHRLSNCASSSSVYSPPLTLSFSAGNQLLSQTLRTEDPLSPPRLIPWTLSQHRFSVPSDQIADIVGQVYHTQRPPLSS